ncbi:MAG TPA: hypothetical protein PKD75_06170 [Tepidiformaceae bacterium]|nr:hypothetical protein [Tepidiformaceae bacterium]
MRPRAYFLFELVAWPAALWCGTELVLRVATGDTGGLGSAGLTGACAALTIVAARWRSRQLTAD